MRFRGVVVSMSCIAAGLLFGCGGPAEGEGGDGGKEGGGLDSAVHDATRDAKSDGRIVTDAARETESDGADAAIGTEPDGTVDTDAPVDAESDGAVVPDATVDAELDGTAVADAGVDVQAESGAVDGMAEDVATQEAGAPNDAAGGTLDASACTLSPLPATPFPPLSGSAYVTGTESAPGGAVSYSNGGPGGIECAALVTNASSGTLTFSFSALGCSLSYVDGSGKTFGSNLSARDGTIMNPYTTIAFDGDTYTCNYFDNDDDENALFGTCQESPNAETAGIISVRLSFTRSTGMVSLSRGCEVIPIGQSCGANEAGADEFPFMTGTSELDLGGSLSCAGSGIDSTVDSGRDTGA